MDIVRVRYFLAVCEHGSFSAAAKACGVSQPSVTTGVQRLERAIGARLFERRHPVRLTPLGAELRPLLAALQATADRVSAAVEAIREGAASLPQPSGLLGRGAKAFDVIGGRPIEASQDTVRQTDPPSSWPSDLSARCMVLIERSSAAIERSEQAVVIFRSTWTRAQG